MRGGNELRMADFVRDGYDEVAPTYLEARRTHSHDLPYLDRLIAGLPCGGSVLDVGCGPGVPVAAHLASAGVHVVGIDISPVQVDLAQQNVPAGEFQVCDMTELRDREFEVDAVVAFYSIFHIPKESHGRLLATLRTFLPIGGRLLCTFGSKEWEGEEPFFGVPMRWSHYGPDESQHLITAAGFDIEFAEIAEHRFEGELERHLVVSAVRA